MKKTLCPFPGCLAIVNTPGHYCFVHRARQAEKDRKAKEHATKRWDAHHAKIDYSWIWQSALWKRMRASHLVRNPYCVRCGEPATTVDHIEPHRGSLDLAYDVNNLQSLCARCGNIKSREDRKA